MTEPALLRETGFDEVHDARRIYRVVLDCVARPGTLGRLPDLRLDPPPGLARSVAAVALTLLDGNVSFHHLGGKASADYIRANTGSRSTEIEEADFVFLNGDDAAYAVELPGCGTPLYPDSGATLVVQVRRLSEQPFAGAWALTLRGPGIESMQELHVAPLNPEILAALQRRNAEYPLGLDVLLCADDDGQGRCCVAGLPRTTRTSWRQV